MNLDDKISPHFTYRELLKSDTANRLNIDNTTDDPDVIKYLKLVAENILEPVRNHYGIPFSPNSVYRCLLLNRALKSKDTSQHTKGQAVDIEIPGVNNLDLFNWCKDNLDFDQIILEFYKKGQPTSGWVHVSYVSPEQNRRKVTFIG